MSDEKESKKDLVGKVINISDIVDYQAGSIVSREIINKGTGTVSVFAFDDGEGLSEHTAPFDALVQIAKGNIEISIDGNPFQVRAGEAIIMPANRPHALKALEKSKMILTLIR